MLPRVLTPAGALIVFLAALALPSTSSARTFTGSLTIESISQPTTADPRSYVAASTSVTQSCDPSSEYCGYSINITTGPVAAPCAPFSALAGGMRGRWVGSTRGHDAYPGPMPIPTSGSWQEDAGATPTVMHACLWAYIVETKTDLLLANTPFTVPALPTSAPPTPTTTAPAASTPPSSNNKPASSPLKKSAAERRVRTVVRKKWRGSKRIRVSCVRDDDENFTCVARFVWRGKQRKREIWVFREDGRIQAGY